MSSQNIPLRVEIFGKETIYVGRDFTEFIVVDILKNAVPKVRVIVIVTDSHVHKLHLPEFLQSFEKLNTTKQDESLGFEKKLVLHYVIPPGEGSKSREMVAKIQDFLIEKACNRDTCLIAMGGGVVGDLVGFIASTYLRGVPLIQIPTTLLAMSDSSIGGKNGIDTPAGKNLIGTTYEPVRIYIDLKYLVTLPQRELFNGMAEVIKTCAISTKENFEFLENNIDEFSNLFQNWNLQKSETYSKLTHLLFVAIKFKAAVVTNDKWDLGQRQFLNYGHTVGHALEIHYAPNLLHGEAISIGMVVEQEIAKFLVSPDTNLLIVKRLKDVLKKMNLPTSILEGETLARAYGIVEPSTPEGLINIMQKDKKNLAHQICITLLAELGLPIGSKATPVPKQEILKQFEIETAFRSSVEVENDTLSESVQQSSKNSSTAGSDETIILIGSSQVNTLGNSLADALNWTFVTEMSELTEDLKQRKVIAIAEDKISTSGMKDFLEKWIQNNGIVVQILTDLQDDDKSNFNELEALSNYTYYYNDKEDLNLATKSILHLVNYAQGKLFPTVMPSLDFRSYFLSLILSDITPILKDLPTMVSGTNAVELRVDIAFDPSKNFEMQYFKSYISQKVSLIRSSIGNHPIIFTVRSSAEGGHLPPEITEQELIDIFAYAVRNGCEYIDLEIGLSSRILNNVKMASAFKSRIISSYHNILQPIDWNGTEIFSKVDKAEKFGDIIKLVSIARTEEDNRSVQKFADDYYSKGGHMLPLIAFNLGELGRITRIKNRFFTPVTHDSLPKDPRLAQLTCKEIIVGLTNEKMILPKEFFIFGHNISYSLSPLIHNTNFNYFNLPYKYSIKDTNDMDEIRQVIRLSTFGGASVTIPHKQTIIPLLDSVSQVVEAIGAVNTIVVKPNGKLHGENTDWLGIRECLKRSLNISTKKYANSSALLIGAGGTARAGLYALNSLGFKEIYLYNRTAAKLQELITSGIVNGTNGTVLKIYNDKETLVDAKFPILAIVDTTPGYSGMCPNRFVNEILSNSKNSSVLVKLAYGNMGSEEEVLQPWIGIVTGKDIVIEQAIWAAELWTGFKPDGMHILQVVQKETGK